MPRIHLYTPVAPHSGDFFLEEGASHHLLHVLRARRGQPLTLFCGDGHDYPAILQGAEQGRARLLVEGARKRDTASPIAITLCLPLLRGERWDWALQKVTELGVARIQPVQTDHSVVDLGGSRAEKRLSRWQEMVIAACEQGQATRIPTLCPLVPLAAFWSAVPAGPGILFDAEATAPLQRSRLPENGELRPQAITLLTGPEGGLSVEERQAAGRMGFISAHLGPRILRAETAAVTAVALVQHLWGDLC